MFPVYVVVLISCIFDVNNVIEKQTVILKEENK